MAGIHISEVSKIYTGGVKAVSSVSIDIVDGEFIVLVVIFMQRLFVKGLVETEK